MDTQMRMCYMDHILRSSPAILGRQSSTTWCPAGIKFERLTKVDRRIGLGRRQTLWVLLESRYLAGEFSRLFRRSTPQDGHIYFSLSAFRWGPAFQCKPR